MKTAIQMITTMLIKQFNSPGVQERNINKLVKQFNRFIKVKNKILVNIVIVSNNEIKKINKQYRSKNKVTDVLSFRYDNANAEIFICYQKASTQAKENKLTIKEEINKLVTHGLLHILGHDHEIEKEAIKMETLENKILNYV